MASVGMLRVGRIMNSSPYSTDHSVSQIGRTPLDDRIHFSMLVHRLLALYCFPWYDLKVSFGFLCPAIFFLSRRLADPALVTKHQDPFFFLFPWTLLLRVLSLCVKWGRDIRYGSNRVVTQSRIEEWTARPGTCPKKRRDSLEQSYGLRRPLLTRPQRTFFHDISIRHTALLAQYWAFGLGKHLHHCSFGLGRRGEENQISKTSN